MGKNSRLFLIAVLVLAVHSAVVAKPLSVTGNVYDIDFGKGQTQILIRPPASGDSTYFVKSEMLQAVLQAAFISGRTVRVQHVNRVILEVAILNTPTDQPCTDPGCVEQLSCTPVECTASIRGEGAPVKTKAGRASGVLFTAVGDNRRVEELAYDTQRVITRVKKVNKP